ncbi:MAG TPA: hypothetical protein PLB96_05150 [Syntrophales bacterium]|nr:hypothetical protein [Syntrophales bacterium]
MTVELGLLLLESILLIVTVLLLIYNIREGKQRDNLLREVGRATRVLTRQEYFLHLMEAMLDAKKEIIGCITGSAPSGDDVKMTRGIVRMIERMTEKGVRIKYLLPKFPDRLQIAVQYAEAGAEILFSSCLMVHTLRFSIMDDKLVILGVPEQAGEREATKKGYKIPSEELALILKNYFNACERQTSLKEYLLEVMEHTGATTAHLAQEFQLDEEVLKKLIR